MRGAPLLTICPTRPASPCRNARRLPKGLGYDFSASTRFDKLFTGIAMERPKSMPVSTEGCEDIEPEYTGEADYGRLLERDHRAATNGYGKGMASQGDSRLVTNEISK